MECDFKKGFLIRKEHIGKVEGMYLNLGEFLLILKSPGLKVQLISKEKVKWLYSISNSIYISDFNKMQERLAVTDELTELWEEEEG